MHAAAEFRDGELFLIDAESMGGTYVGETRITEYQLRPGDTFQIGDSRLRYAQESTEEETTLGAGLRNPPASKTPRFKDLIGEQLADFQLEEIIAAGAWCCLPWKR